MVICRLKFREAVRMNLRRTWDAEAVARQILTHLFTSTGEARPTANLRAFASLYSCQPPSLPSPRLGWPLGMAKPPLPWREIDDKTPVEYVQENPKKIGSNAFDFYEKYKKSKTFGEAKANGARAEDFRFDYAKGLLKIHFINAPKVSKGLENKGPTRKSKPEPRPKQEPKLDAKTLMKADLEAAKDKVAPFPTFARSSGADSPKLPRSMAVGPLGSLPSRARKVPEETEGATLAAAGAPGKKSPGSKSPKSPKSPPGSKADPKEPVSTPVKRKADGQPEESKDTRENKKAKKDKSRSKSSGNSASSSPRRAKANSVVGQPGSKSPAGSKADSKATASSATKRKAEAPLKEKKEKKDKRDKKDKKDKKEKRHEKQEKKHKKEKREKRRLTGKSSPTKAGEASTKVGQVSKSSKDRTRKGINISFGLAKLLKNSQGKTKGALSKKSSANGKKSSDNGSKQDADGLWVRTGDGKTCTSKYIGVIKSQNRGYRVQFNHAYLGICETEQEAARMYAKARKEFEESGRSPQMNASRAPRASNLGRLIPPDHDKEELQKKAREVDRKNDSQQRQDGKDGAAVQTDHKKEELQKKVREPERKNDSQQRQDGKDGTAVPTDQKKEELQKKAREVERKNDSQQRQEDVPDAGAVAPDHDKEELQKKIRELERQNESQQRQIQALEAEKELAAPAPAPVQEFVAPAPIPPPRPEAGYAAEFFNTTNSTEGSHVLGWIGDGGGWEPGGEPPRNAPLPPIPPGDTEPPGPCGPMCRCGQVVSKASEVEKPWIADEVRRQAILAAIERFQSHPGVERRGKVSRQNRFEPAAPEKMNRALTSEPSRTQYTREVRVLR
eukprot:s806_g4.t3